MPLELKLDKDECEEVARDLINLINRNFNPQDIYSEKDLALWAKMHGYVKKEED